MQFHCGKTVKLANGDACKCDTFVLFTSNRHSKPELGRVHEILRYTGTVGSLASGILVENCVIRQTEQATVVYGMPAVKLTDSYTFLNVQVGFIYNLLLRCTQNHFAVPIMFG